jgi:biopolymer transport protein ExbD
MSDPDPQTRDLRAALNPSAPARKETRNIPPLVWIVVVMLIVVVVLAFFGWRATTADTAKIDNPAAASATAPSGV